MRFVFFIALALMFSSCATTANYEKTLKSWVGGKENQLIMSWGYKKGKVNNVELIAPYKHKVITLSSFKNIDDFVNNFK
jgi:hypothetical protein